MRVRMHVCFFACFLIVDGLVDKPTWLPRRADGCRQHWFTVDSSCAVCFLFLSHKTRPCIPDRGSWAACSVKARIFLRRLGIVALFLLCLPLLAVAAVVLLLLSPLTIFQHCSGRGKPKYYVVPDFSRCSCSCEACDCCCGWDCHAVLYVILLVFVALFMLALLPVTLFFFATNACNFRFMCIFLFCAPCYEDDD